MTLTKWEPFAIDFPERWKRLLDFDEQGSIRVEEIHEDDSLVVRAELPGVDPDKDIDVSISDGVLHIGATRSERTEKKSKDHSFRSEFRYGSFSRNMTLPRGVEAKSVKAEYKDGVLEVRIPWPAENSSAAEKVEIIRG